LLFESTFLRTAVLCEVPRERLVGKDKPLNSLMLFCFAKEGYKRAAQGLPQETMQGEAWTISFTIILSPSRENR
jgi:hypothetical protein